MSSSGSKKFLGFVLVWLLILGGGAAAYKFIIVPDGGIPFFGKKASDHVDVPFILWGGDVATFLANGGLETKPGTIFDKHGLKLRLTRGDDFDKQVKDYLDNKTPFLRGTMSMLGQASERLAKDPNARPVVFLQLTWSAGDYLVGKAPFKNLNDLRGKKIALQKDGPHVGMLDDILNTAKLRWDDIRVAWTDDVTGDKGPEALFRKDATIDGCFVVTTDMIKLTGGADQTGTGVKGTAEGAHVVVSTKDMSRSIADVYACRKDFYDQHRDQVEKFAAGYLKACEELQELKKGYDAKEPGATAQYKDLLKLTQNIYGEKDIPEESDADGLIADAVFVHLPGNVSFFKEAGNLSGFRPKMKAALDLAIALGDAKQRHEFLTANLDYDELKRLGDLTRAPDEQRRVFVSGYHLPGEQELKKNTIYSFEISYGPSETSFPAEKYGENFQRAAEQGSLFGRSAIAIRGHADLVQLLATFVKEALKNDVIERTGKTGHYQYYVKEGGGRGARFELSDTRKVVELINTHKLTDSKMVLDSCLQLSQQRADAARKAVLEYARSKNYNLDENQIVAVGVGVLEPLVAVPRSDPEMARNRRVEFRLIRTTTEALTTSGVDI